MQQSLGDSHEEVERLHNVIRNLQSVTTEALLNFRQNLSQIKDQSIMSKSTLVRVMEDINDFLKSQSATELRANENVDLKILLKKRDEEIAELKRLLVEKESEAFEQDRLVRTIKHQYDSEAEETKQLKNAHRDLETREEAKLQEIKTLKNSLSQHQHKIQELESKLESIHLDHQKDIKEARDNLQIEFKTEMDTLRSRYKLMAASMENMDRSPSDTSLEKIEVIFKFSLLQKRKIVSFIKI